MPKSHFYWLALAALLSANALGETARNSYLLECQGCHGLDGSGAIATVPSLKDHMAKFLLVPGGREFLVRVPGSAQSSLTDQELADTLNWMLSHFGPGDIAGPLPGYSAQEVSSLRKLPLIDVESTRAALIEAIRQIDGNEGIKK